MKNGTESLYNCEVVALLIGFHTAKPDASSNKCNSLLKRTIRFEKLKFYQQLFPARCDYTNRMSKLDTVNWSLIIDMLYAEWHLSSFESEQTKLGSG
ncbi:hypothetical protein T05_12133 [Trichinella murrelli]|uniref:Uncharacterized protein n=1 Tax=Trichinella murrelli TaxID=144512 RepID=A0A0V0TYI9_9BILA|nr:hypothetical protein T05_12133 [Trichinella murrelli]